MKKRIINEKAVWFKHYLFYKNNSHSICRVFSFSYDVLNGSIMYIVPSVSPYGYKFPQRLSSQLQYEIPCQTVVFSQSNAICENACTFIEIYYIIHIKKMQWYFFPFDWFRLLNAIVTFVIVIISVVLSSWRCYTQSNEQSDRI